MLRTGPKGYFISENYIIPNEIGLISFGGRTIMSNVSLDYSLWIPVGAGNQKLIAIPYLWVSIPLNKKKH